MPLAPGHCLQPLVLPAWAIMGQNCISKCQEPSYKKSLRLELKEPLCFPLTLHLRTSARGTRAPLLPASGQSEVQKWKEVKTAILHAEKPRCHPARGLPFYSILFINVISILISSLLSLNCPHPLKNQMAFTYIHPSIK